MVLPVWPSKVTTQFRPSPDGLLMKVMTFCVPTAVLAARVSIEELLVTGSGNTSEIPLTIV